MNKKSVRVRFAPSPTGLMHLGNIRTALLNYLFAKNRNGTFILRIEDTDRQRNFDPGGKKILADLDWLSLSFNEGPFFQSERTALYQEKLKELQEKGCSYRCFCTQEELEKKRQRQIALKQPPRYDRTCLKLSKDEIAEKLAQHVPFIWRMKLDPSEKITIQDMARGPITFELKNFSDFPLTRQDGSATFMFANFVDDADMHITHVLRGEDHLTNTAGQAALYKALGLELPIFWHLPILCNIEGKKLSKRDFGFSLHDLRQAGYLPEAICNYLATIGGGTFKNEIMSLDELARAMDFEHIPTSGQIKYDVEKLRWVNHKWIERISPELLVNYTKPFLIQTYPQAAELDEVILSKLLQVIKTEMVTLDDAAPHLKFYFEAPQITKKELESVIDNQQLPMVIAIIKKHLDCLGDTESCITKMKKSAKEQGASIKSLFTGIRMGLMGKAHGPGVVELINMLGIDESKKRLEKLI